MRVAILQTGHAPESLQNEHGDYDSMSKIFLGYEANEIKTYNIQKGEFPTSPANYDLYLITGSPKGVYDGDNWIDDLEDFIRVSYASSTKLIGVCFGHQIMAQALGGKVRKSDKGYGIGVMDYDHAETGKKLSLCAWHQDQVEEKPEDGEVILSSKFCPIAGLIYNNRAISFQPHPEFTKAFVDDLITVRNGDTITNAQANMARETLTKDNDYPIVQGLIREFLAI